MENIKLLLVLMMTFILVGCSSKLDVTEADIQRTVDYMEEDAAIIEVAVGVDEELIHCAVSVKDSVGKEERMEIGEKCAKILNATVTEGSIEEVDDGDLGELYNHYSLEMTVANKDEISGTLLGVKQAKSEQIQWNSHYVE